MKMKIYQTVHKTMAAIGFTPNQQQNNQRQWSSGHIFSVVINSINTFSLSAYIFYEANGIEEYMDSIFSLTMTVGVSVAFISIIFKNDKLFNAIEGCAKEIADSK